MRLDHVIMAFDPRSDELLHRVQIPESEASTVREMLGNCPWPEKCGDVEIPGDRARLVCRAYGSSFEIDDLVWVIGAYKHEE